MNALALDGASSTFTVAVKAGDRCVQTSLRLGARYGEHILNEIIHVLEVVNLRPADLDYVVLDKGPGAFTGLRLAYVTAKALTLARGTPVYAVPTLRAFAHPFRSWSGAVLPCLDAKQGRFFTAVFRRGAECASAGARTAEETASVLDAEEPVFVVGSSDTALLAETLAALRPAGVITALDSSLNTPSALFELAEEGAAPLEAYAGPDYFAFPY